MGKAGSLVSTLATALAPSFLLSENDAVARTRLLEYMKTGSSYLMLQGTKPELLGVALNDSPVALCSWVLEKLYEWTDRSCSEQDFEPALTKDQMLTNISVYWFTGTSASSCQYYYENGTYPGVESGMLDVE